MPKRQIDASRFLETSGFELNNQSVETPAQKRERIQTAMHRAAETADAIKEGLTEHAHAENERLRRAYRRATSDLTLDMRDLMGGVGNLPPADLFPEERASMAGMRQGHEFLTEQFPTSQDDMVMEDLYNVDRVMSPPASSVRQVQQRYQQRRPLREDMMPTQQRQQAPQRQAPQRQAPQLDLRGQTATSENWIAKKYLGETRGGDTVPVWKVQNKRTGSGVDKMFRIEGVAARVAMLLNESNNQYDPRIVSLISAYDKRDNLLKEARLLEKSADGKPMKTQRLRAIHAEINQLDYRLGI